MTIEPVDPRFFSDFNGLSKLMIDLIHQERLTAAAYVVSILQTDLAEQGLGPARKEWPRPGQAAPDGWHVYEAALRWCHDGFAR